MAQTRKFSIHEVRQALEKHTGEKIEDLEIEDEQGNRVRGGLAAKHHTHKHKVREFEANDATEYLD